MTKAIIKVGVQLAFVSVFCITLDGSNEEYHLTGNVKWCKQNESEIDYGVGIQLKNRVGISTDLNNWKQLAS